MAAIPTILKGDDSGAITINIASGRTYTGATLVVAYQGVTRQYTNLTPGGSVTLAFTHDETSGFALKTAPLLMRLIGQYGAEETVENAEARIRVTDCLAEVNAGGSFTVQPGGTVVDPTKVPITEVGDVAARYTLADLQAKVNQIVRVLAQRSLMAFGLCAMFASAATAEVSVQTARLDELWNDSRVVTNVTGGGGSGVDTNSVKSIINAEVGGTNTLVHSSQIADFVTKSVTNGLAAKAWVTAQGYLTEETDPTATAKAQAAIAAAGCVTTNENEFFNVSKFVCTTGGDTFGMTPSSISWNFGGGSIFTLNPTTGFFVGDYQHNYLLPNMDGYGTDYTHDIALRSQIPTSSDYIAPKGTTNSVDTLLAAARTDSESISATAIANANTTYTPTNALVSLNQSVQYVTPSGGSVSIVLPPLVQGRLRDFVVYAYPSADTEVNFSALPHARFADDSVTNAVKANVVTALYFTEVEPNTHIFAVGRANLEKGW